jgi:hypothetical protein
VAAIGCPGPRRAQLTGIIRALAQASGRSPAHVPGLVSGAAPAGHLPARADARQMHGKERKPD